MNRIYNTFFVGKINNSATIMKTIYSYTIHNK